MQVNNFLKCVRLSTLKHVCVHIKSPTCGTHYGGCHTDSSVISDFPEQKIKAGCFQALPRVENTLLKLLK